MAQAIPVVFGANFGTTFSLQIFALGIGEFGPAAMFGGFPARTLLKGEHGRAWGGAEFGICLFGLHTIVEGAWPLKDQPAVPSGRRRWRLPSTTSSPGRR